VIADGLREAARPANRVSLERPALLMGQRVLQMGNFVRASGKPVRYGHCGDEPSSQQGAGELSKEPRALHFWGRQVVDQARPWVSTLIVSHRQ